MSDFINEFITQRQYLKNVSARTIDWYSQSFKRFDGALESRASLIARITQLRQEGIKAISVNTYLRCINAYLRWLHIEHGHPLLKIPRLQEDKKVLATFSPDQVKRLIGFKPRGANAIRAHLIACVALDCGLRIGEVLSLTWDQVDLDNLCLKVKGKGSKERVVPISFELRKLLFRCPRKPNWPLVFSTRAGNQLSQRNVQRDFKLLCQRVGLTGVRCSPHTLRHTFAVSYLRNGGNLFYLSRILGHTSVKTTERYLQSIEIGDLNAVHNRLSALAVR